MGYEFNNQVPIYLQILEYFKEAIISGKYAPNEKIPSVRDLSVTFEVNPNTIQKALFELEEMGLIYTARTNGKFVTEDVQVIKKLRQEVIDEKISQFFESMSKLGIDKAEMIKILKEE